MHYIYIVFSSTHNRIGRMVRKITGESYNHASIALDENLSRMYGFARRYYQTPLYGGFVRESLSRYHQNGYAAQICICRIPVTQEQYDALEKKLGDMYENRQHYLYNHLSALGALAHRRIRARDAYTCIEFCVQILHTLGIEVDPQKYYSVCDVKKMLESCCIYTGPIPTGEYDADFYRKSPVPYPIWNTLRDMVKLLPRLNA